MQRLANTTSPFVRIARIAMIGKGIDIEPTIVDPWADDVRLRIANAATRTPTLVLDDARSRRRWCSMRLRWACAAAARRPLGRVTRAGIGRKTRPR